MNRQRPDIHLTGYGVTVAALRGDQQAVQALFQGLNRAATAGVTEAALMTMGQLVRDLLDPEDLDQIITDLQKAAAEQAAA